MKLHKSNPSSPKLSAAIVTPIFVLLVLAFVSLYDMAFSNHYSHIDRSSSSSSLPSPANSSSLASPATTVESCDLTRGQWVPDDEAPYYTNLTCPFIDDHQNCMKFGKPSLEFMRWRWRPDGCDLPRFDAARFLEVMRGKSMAFVGDSLARNHLKSLLCLLSKWLARKLIFKKGDAKLDRTTYAGKKKIRKFKESAWKGVYFLSGELLALSVTYNEPWFTTTRNFWVGPGDQVWLDQKIKLKLKAVYMYVAGFYTYSIFALLFWETRRSDFGISMTHHVATVCLIALSYIFRFARVGSVVLAIHDAIDVFLEVAKISKYSGHNLLADVSFLVFVISWVLLRLIYYPFWILWSTSYEVVLTIDKEKHKFDGPIYYYVFNTLLFSLLVLHIYWWVLMYRMLVNQIQSRGHVGDDIRSDSEDEEEHED